MAALLDNFAVIKDQDLIAKAAGGKPVRDVDGCLAADNVVELCINLGLGDGVK